MIRFLIYFSISFLILSIPIKTKQLFYYFDQLATPYTRPALQKAGTFIREQLSDKKILGMKIIGKAQQDEGPGPVPKVLATSKKLLQRKIGEKAELLLNSSELAQKSKNLGAEYYSERELLELKTMLKNSDI